MSTANIGEHMTLHEHTVRVSNLANTENVAQPNSFWTDYEMTVVLLRQTYTTRCRAKSVAESFPA